MDAGSNAEHWERQADNWLGWARTPGHDSYWHYAPLFLDEILPAPGRATLDIGCGEGRLARELRHRGHRVVALDRSATMLRHAVEADADNVYVLGDAARLPFADETFDVTVAYNSLMDVDDLGSSVLEAGRVLVAGGALSISITHPINDAGSFTSTDPGAPFSLEGSYFDTRTLRLPVERDRHSIVFQSYARPLEDYFAWLKAAGLVVDVLREPRVPESALRQMSSYERWDRVPMFLFLRAIKA